MYRFTIRNWNRRSYHISCVLILLPTLLICGQALSVPQPSVSEEDLLDIARNSDDLTALSNSIELEPDRGVLFLERALVSARLGLFAESMEDFNTAMSIGPSGQGDYAAYSEGILDLIVCTRTAYNERIPFDPDFSNSLDAKLDEAVAYLDSAIELDSDNPELYFTRARAHGFLIDWPKASEDLSIAIDLDPGYIQAYAGRGNINSERGFPDEAILDLTRAIELAPDSACYYGYRAFAYQMLGDEEKAQADLEIASRLTEEINQL